MAYEFPKDIRNKFPSLIKLVSYEYTKGAPSDMVNVYRLPLPSNELMDGVNATYDVDFGDTASKLVGSIQGKLNKVKEAGSYASQTISKNTMPTFQTMEHRKLQLSWVLTPKNKSDADSMMAIVNNLKKDATAEKIEHTGNVLLSKPLLWKIFLEGDVPLFYTHPNGYVVESISTSFNTTRWSQFTDGNPTSVNIVMTFIERSRITRDILG